MRATYIKRNNLVVVELALEEVEQYLATEHQSKDPDLTFNSEDNQWELQIPCSLTFYNNTQRRRGGAQPWTPEELRAAVRATVANRLLPVPTASTFDTFKEQHHQLTKDLLRNVRLVFPTSRRREGP